jgi:hypothetical protein
MNDMTILEDIFRDLLSDILTYQTLFVSIAEFYRPVRKKPSFSEWAAAVERNEFEEFSQSVPLVLTIIMYGDHSVNSIFNRLTKKDYLEFSASSALNSEVYSVRSENNFTVTSVGSDIIETCSSGDAPDMIPRLCRPRKMTSYHFPFNFVISQHPRLAEAVILSKLQESKLFPRNLCWIRDDMRYVSPDYDTVYEISELTTKFHTDIIKFPAA